MGLNDKFNIGLSIKYSTDLGGGSGHFILHQIWVRLYADDLTYWNLHAVSGTGSSNPGSYWIQSDVDWATNQRFVEFEGESQDIDFTQWQSISAEAAPLPRSGKIEILLINNQTSSSQEKDYSSLSFDYLPFIDGSYGLLKDQYFKTTRPDNYRLSISDEIGISASPRKLFKWALLKFIFGDTSDYKLVDQFYEGQEYLYANDGINHLAAYGDLQVRAYHNQFRNSDETFPARCQGLGAGAVDGDGFDDSPDIIHKYFNRDQDPTGTNSQAFQLVTQNKNWKDCLWAGTLIKNFDKVIGFVYDDIEFKFESDKS